MLSTILNEVMSLQPLAAVGAAIGGALGGSPRLPVTSEAT